ncbi:MAG: hypothetical protein FD175_2665 [Beijerinckiaceae bacterium]|nr:MAG: hypothetical protein FD175_2665 [Beijerinckiaceae bacterium]
MSHGHAHGHGHDDHGGSNKKIGLLIAILALLLSFAEMGNKLSENESIAKNLEASNFWSFFQAKTIRRTAIQVAAEEMQVTVTSITDPASKAKAEAQIKKWTDTAARYESEPETGEGRKELAARAKVAEQRRDFTKARAHVFEYASALLQIAIVIASTAVITGLMAMAFGAIALGFGGIGLMAIAIWAPMALHFGH